MYKLASYAAPALEEIYPRTRSQVTAVIDDLKTPMMTSLSYIIVEAVTGIFGRTSVGLNMHVSNRVFGCRIGLKWVREV